MLSAGVRAVSMPLSMTGVARDERAKRLEALAGNGRDRSTTAQKRHLYVRFLGNGRGTWSQLKVKTGSAWASVTLGEGSGSHLRATGRPPRGMLLPTRTLLADGVAKSLSIPTGPLERNWDTNGGAKNYAPAVMSLLFLYSHMHLPGADALGHGALDFGDILCHKELISSREDTYRATNLSLSV